MKKKVLYGACKLMAEVYDFDLSTIENNSAYGKIADMLQPNKTILECGCATGYFTRYMRDRLNAKVYVIEYNKKAFDTAKQFAEDGICADLETNDWVEKFAQIRFDYIIFSDVLEHLRNPDQVLTQAVNLLADDGKIIISIPNIAHTDIIVNLFHNRWTYMPIGLLDDTHIHFWGRDSFRESIENASLKAVVWDYVIRPPFFTEQAYEASGGDIKYLQFLNAICSRPFGDVYQYVVSAQKSGYVDENNLKYEDRYEECHEKYGNTPWPCIEYEAEARKREEEIVNLKLAYDEISNSFFWKVSEPIRKVLDYIKERKILLYK